MKFKKLIATFTVTVVLCIGAMFTLCGCELFSGSNSKSKIHEVTSLSEVGNENYNYVLTQDIDFEGGEEKLLMCNAKVFDGGGHTIKNLNLRGQYAGNSGQLSIFNTVDTIKNLNIENLTINAPNNYTHISALVWNKVNLIENVHIKNLTMNVTQAYMGTGFGRSAKEMFVAGFTTVDSVIIRNCTLKDSTITVNGYNDSDHNHVADMHVAGMATSPAVMSHCGIENSTIKVDSTSVFSDIEVGGLSSRGDGSGEFLYCYAKDNKITADASWSSKSQYSGSYITPTAKVGGIAATAQIVNFCSAKDNAINSKASGTLVAGSIAGRVQMIHQSIANGNTLACTGGRNDNEDKDIFRATGGLAGRITSSVTSCISVDNNVSDSAIHTVAHGSNRLYTGGLAGLADADSSSFKTEKCFVAGNTVSGGNTSNSVAVGYDGKWDIFIDGSVDHTDTDTAVIVSKLNLEDPTWVLANLGLNANSWILADGEYPEINTVYTPIEEENT